SPYRPGRAYHRGSDRGHHPVVGARCRHLLSVRLPVRKLRRLEVASREGRGDDGRLFGFRPLRRGEGARPDPRLPRRAVGRQRGRLAGGGRRNLPPRPPARREVVGPDDATHDIKRIRLKIVSGGPFDFSAGQFASVTFEGCPPRDYSMANVPGDPILEFHVRRTAGGAPSGHVSEKLKLGDHVRVEGPFGPSYLRETHRGPIIAVAGGSGMAPIKSVVERALQKALPQHIYFYFGVRSERDLYLHDHFVRLAETHKNLHFIPVLSEGDSAERRQGLVHEAVAEDFDEFDGCKAYLAGPPVMVEAATRLVERRGMRRVDIHADAFYTAAEMASAGKKTGAEL